MSFAELNKIGTRRTTTHLLTVMLAALILGGCGTATTRIDAEDNRVALPALSANINFGDGTQAASELHTGNAIEIGIAKAKGSDSQSLVTGQPPVILNGTKFSPDQLRNDFNYDFANVSWRWRKFFSERSLGLEVSAGAGFSSLNLAVSSSTQYASDHLYSRGPLARVGLIWRLNPSTSLQGRVSAFLSSSDHGVNSMAHYELFYAKAFQDNLTLRAGYAIWEVNGEGLPGMSDFQLRLSGPALALVWDFNAGN